MPRKFFSIPFFALLFLSPFLLLPNAAAQSVPIVFDLPSGLSPSNIFIQFLNTTNTMTGTYKDTTGTTQNLAANTAYSMAQITSPVSVGGSAPANKPAVLISKFDSGRVFINYGTAGLQGLTAGYQPAANNPSDANYTTRYQYFEPTIDGAQINVDMSYIDFASIPMSLAAVNAPHASNSPQLTTGNGWGLAHATAASGTTFANNVLPAASDLLPSTSFARVISPNLNGTYYHDWTHYLKTTLPGQTARLSGFFVGVGNQPTGNPLTQAQSYDFIATFNSDGSVTMTAQSGSGNGYAACVPAVQQGPGVGSTNQTVTVSFDALNAITGVYGNNPAYTVNQNGTITNTTGIVNDFFGRVIGDLLAGLSFGFPGSTVQYNGTAIGALSSTQWWGGTMTDGTIIDLANTPSGQGLYFDKAQPGQPLNYHTYAASLTPLTPAYGFPLQDRLNNNLLVFNTTTDTGSYLLVTINPDGAANVPADALLLLP